jgi:hypothetical protein
MNRTTALLLTLALLLAHTLAIYHAPDGGFGPPCDDAHVVYRIARNAALDGEAAFEVGGQGPEMSPPLPWVQLARWAVSFGTAPTTLSQIFSILFGLACVTVLGLFSSNRLAGLIAPLLLVVNGTLAASCGDGTSTTCYTFAITFAFYCFQRRWSGALGAALVFALTLRDEGVLFVLALMALECVRMRSTPARLRWVLAFGPPALVIALRVYSRAGASGGGWAPELLVLLQRDPQRWNLGWHYLVDHTLLFGVGALTLVPLALALAGRLSRAGAEALTLALLGALLVVAQGGSRRPFGSALVPMLPLLCLAVQEGMQKIIDRERRWLELSIWATLALGAVWSALPSKLPGDIALLPTRGAFVRWITPSRPVADAWQQLLARRGLETEIVQTRRLRALGLYLRDRVPPGTSVLSAWPGAIGYLSRQPVRDLLGRVAPAAGEQELRPWTGAPRIDLSAALREGAEWIVLPPNDWIESRSLEEALMSLAQLYDASSAAPGRSKELLAAAQDYELVAIPTPRREDALRAAGLPVAILRRKATDRTPVLALQVDEREFEVRLVHRGPPLVADLVVEWTDEAGVSRMLRPWGAFEAATDVRARVSLLLVESGSTPIRLLRAALPRVFAGGTLRASLCNPVPAADTGARAEIAACESRVSR